MFAFCPSTKILTIFACINKASRQLKSHFYLINYLMGNGVTVNQHTAHQYHNTNITIIPVSVFVRRHQSIRYLRYVFIAISYVVMDNILLSRCQNSAIYLIHLQWFFVFQIKPCNQNASCTGRFIHMYHFQLFFISI